MLKIRLKGKYLVLAAAILLVLAGAALAAVPKMIYDRAQALDSQGKPGQAWSYYDFLNRYFPHSDEAVRALFFSAQGEVQDYSSGEEPGLIYVFPGSTGMSGRPGETGDIASAIAKFKLVRERAPESPWATHALRELGKAYYALGDQDNAVKYLKLSIEESDLQASESTELLARIYLARGENKKALELVQRSLQERPGFSPLDMMGLQGQALMAMGQWEAARQVFEELPRQAAEDYGRTMADQEPEMISLNVQHWETLARGYLHQLDALQEGDAAGATGVLSGRVLLDGHGLQGARVFLIDLALNKDYYPGHTRGLIREITGPGGEFTFTGLPPGRYALGVGVRLEEVQGYTMQKWQGDVVLEAGGAARRDLQFVPTVKLNSPLAGAVESGQFKFSWEPVGGAASYDLFLGQVTRDDDGKIVSTYTTTLKSGIRESSLTIDLEEERARTRFGGGIAYDGELVSPISILGLLYPGGEYTWGVFAYDAGGTQISDSSGYGFYRAVKELPLFKVDGELNAADRLLLDHRHEEALAAYQKQLGQDPHDTHALLVLARLYQYGISYKDQDPETAAGYYERLLAIEDFPEVREALAECYFSAGQDDKARAMYHSLLGTSLANWRTHYQLARIQFNRGQPRDALETLGHAVNMEHGAYVRTYPVALALLLGETEGALNFARRVDEGERYQGLLESYLEQGYEVRALVRQAVLQGEYGPAQELLTNSQHDLFTKGLLVYLTGRTYPREELAQIIQEMEPGLPAELLRYMFM